MQIINLLDPKLGGRIRAVLTVVLGATATLLAILQSAADVLDQLPQWKWVSTGMVIVLAAMQAVTHFSALGNKALDT